MHRLTRALFTLLTAILLTVSGCSKSVEGESKKWENNRATVTTLAAQYPAFKGAIDARQTSAQTIFDAADGLDGESKINKLAEANQTLMSGFVRELEQVDRKIQEIRRKRSEVASNASDESARLAAKVAAEDADRTITRVEAMLRQGASDEAAAKALTSKALRDLDNARRALDAVTSAEKKKTEKAAEAVEAEKAAGEAEKAVEEAAKAPWKCSYCGQSNENSENACGSCGAPR